MKYALSLVGLCALTACGASPESAASAPPVTSDASVTGDDRPAFVVDIPPVDKPPVTDAGIVVADVGAQDVPIPRDVPPITAPEETWTWVDEPESRCANGTPTGFGVNLTRSTGDLLIFLQGGGACWDGASCWGPVSTSFFVRSGYGRTEFSLDVLRPVMFPLRRTSENPFRRFNLVYVPYCTGDVHGGTRVARYRYNGAEINTYHMGARNLALYLDRIAATFPNPARVYLVGDSAGGFGSALNLWRVRRAFPRARVDVVDDSGQPIDPATGRWSSWTANWGLELPPDCPDCGESVDRFTAYYRRRYPDTRFALFSYSHDAVISTFMGLDAFTFNRRLNDFLDRADREWPSARYYVSPGALHVGFAAPPLLPTPGFIAWVGQMVNDDPTWRSRR